jgi:hypothetical protein
MTRPTYIFMILFLIHSLISASQTESKIQRLENNILKQVASDLRDQSDSFYLFTLKASTKPDKQYPKVSVADSTEFMFQMGSFLRFYLICDGDPENYGILKLYKKSNSQTIPNLLLKEIKCFGNESKVVSFDYILNDFEEFNLYLKLENNKNASAVAVVTQYKPKSDNKKTKPTQTIK